MENNSWEALLEVLRKTGTIPRERLVKAWRKGAISVPIEIQEYCGNILAKAISDDRKPVVVSSSNWIAHTQTCH